MRLASMQDFRLLMKWALLADEGSGYQEVPDNPVPAIADYCLRVPGCAALTQALMA